MSAKHKHRWVLDEATGRYRCEVDECPKTMSQAQHATLGKGRAQLNAKHATRRAQRAGADVLTGNEPAVPDTGPLGPKVVDTPYPSSSTGAPSSSAKVDDQSSTDPDQSSAPVDQSSSTGGAPVGDQSTGRGKSGLARALRQALGLED